MGWATERLLLEPWRDCLAGVAGCDPACPDFLVVVTVFGVFLRDAAGIACWAVLRLSLDFWLTDRDCWSCARASWHRWPDVTSKLLAELERIG